MAKKEAPRLSLGSGQIDFPSKDDGKESKNSGGYKVSTAARVLTVIAYIISVSTAAALLSAYYIFLWVPQPTEPMQQRQIRVTDSPFSLPQHGNSHMTGGSYYHYPKNSFSNSMELSKQVPPSSSRASKKAHAKTTPSPGFLPRPQYLVGRQQMLLPRARATAYPYYAKTKK